MSTTRKKIKVIGTEHYINHRTGTLEEMQVVSIEDRDANFYKLWLEHIIHSMDIIGNQKIRFAFWLIDQMDDKNQIICTMRRMEEESGMSLKTIRITLKALLESDFLIKVQNGVYQVNPNVIFKGGKTARMNVLIKYQTDKTSKKPQNEENFDQPSES